MTRPDKSTRRLLQERRTATRFPCALHANCHPNPGATSEGCPAVVRDISRTGVGLVTGPAFALGARLRVLFGPLRGGGAVVADAQVVYAHPDARGWVHGCQFLRPLDEGDLADLVR